MQKIIFLHHSTGHCIWVGDTNKYLYKLTRKGTVQRFFEDYNRENGTDYKIENKIFPKKQPYGWKNYPYDYYNIWIKNAGGQEYMGEPTLEILTRAYDVIIFKHCFPAGKILEDNGQADIDSEEKTIGSYKLQYNALKQKMHSFPGNKFIVWTPPASVEGQVSKEQALRTHRFYRWMIEEWNEEGDNIFVWDFYGLETEGDLYMKKEYAWSPNDSHPGKEFSEKAANDFCEFIIDVLEKLATV